MSGTILVGLSNQPMGWGFHTMRDGIGPGNSRFRPRCVGISDVWKDSRFGDATFIFPGNASSKYPSQLAMSQWGCGLHTMRGGIDPGNCRLHRHRFVGDVHV